MNNQTKKAVFCFINGNPPNIQHEKFINSLINVASNKKAYPFVFLSSEQDITSQPLNFTDKVNYFKKVFSYIYIYENKINNYLDIVSYLYYKNFQELYVCTWIGNNEDLYSFQNFINSNGLEQIKLEKFEIIPVINTNPDKDPVNDTLFNSVIDNNYAEFKKVAMGNTEGDCSYLFRLLKKSVGIQESSKFKLQLKKLF